MSCLARLPSRASRASRGQTHLLTPRSCASKAMSYSVSVSRPSLGAAPDDAAAKTHHVNSKDGSRTHFQNPYPSGRKQFTQWTMPFKLLKGHMDGSIRMPVPASEKDVVPVREPTFLATRFEGSELRTTWLGHACHYTEFPSGLRVLFDPVLEDRCSPLTFAGPQRYTRPACAIADLPFLDAVVISHSHYDHLSVATVREIKAGFPGAHFFVGLGLARWFRDAGVANVTELDWWEDVEVTVTLGDEGGGGKGDGPITATFSSLPAQHTSSRNSFDADKTLWCSWAVTSTGPPRSPVTKSLYFGGDTGYRGVPYLPESEDDWGDKYAHLPTNPDFKKIGELRGPFDVGLLPIGAYKPRYLMSPIHSDPRDAVEIFRDTRCERALGIHWSTWPLTSEPILEPPGKLREALRRRGLAETGVFDICDVGESRTF